MAEVCHQPILHPTLVGVCQSHAPAASPSGKTWYPLYSRLDGLGVGLKDMENLAPPRDSMPGTFNSQSAAKPTKLFRPPALWSTSVDRGEQGHCGAGGMCEPRESAGSLTRTHRKEPQLNRRVLAAALPYLQLSASQSI